MALLSSPQTQEYSTLAHAISITRIDTALADASSFSVELPKLTSSAHFARSPT